MKAHPHWKSVRMRTLHTSTTPDCPIIRSVTLPASWSDASAQALAYLSSTAGGPIRLVSEASRWIDMIDATPKLPYTKHNTTSLSNMLSHMLLTQKMVPNQALWQRNFDIPPGFIIKLSSFVIEGDFHTENFITCLQTACESLRRLEATQAPQRNGELPLFETPSPIYDSIGHILLTDLAATLASLGIDYEEEAGHHFALTIVMLTRLITSAGTPRAITPQAFQFYPNIEHAAYKAIAGLHSEQQLAPIEIGFSSSNPMDSLLDVEACGAGPILSLLDDNKKLRPSTLQRLAHKGITPQDAFAMMLDGQNPLSTSNVATYNRMHALLHSHCDIIPEPLEPEYSSKTYGLKREARRPLPMRQTGFSQRASIGGHRLFMRTSEFDDGTLGALTLTPPQESHLARGLMENLGHAISIGLQYGAPLEAFVEQFAYTRFGPCGTVEGDNLTTYATSMLDYAFRTLSEAYLGKQMPDAPSEKSDKDTPPPMLPFESNTK